MHCFIFVRWRQGFDSSVQIIMDLSKPYQISGILLVGGLLVLRSHPAVKTSAMSLLRFACLGKVAFRQARGQPEAAEMNRRKIHKWERIKFANEWGEPITSSTINLRQSGGWHTMIISHKHLSVPVSFSVARPATTPHSSGSARQAPRWEVSGIKKTNLFCIGSSWLHILLYIDWGPGAWSIVFNQTTRLAPIVSFQTFDPTKETQLEFAKADSIEDLRLPAYSEGRPNIASEHLKRTGLIELGKFHATALLTFFFESCSLGRVPRHTLQVLVPPPHPCLQPAQLGEGVVSMQRMGWILPPETHMEHGFGHRVPFQEGAFGVVVSVVWNIVYIWNIYYTYIQIDR